VLVACLVLDSSEYIPVVLTYDSISEHVSNLPHSEVDAMSWLAFNICVEASSEELDHRSRASRMYTNLLFQKWTCIS
jgi:hypothetical protein